MPYLSTLLSVSWPMLIISEAFIGWFAILFVYRLFFHPLRKVPGPQLAKLTELWRTLAYVKGSWHDEVLALHQEYGHVVRIAPNEVSIVDKDGLLAIYGHTSASKKTSWYNVWIPPNSQPGVFNATNPHQHSFLRHRVATVYTLSSILSMEERIQTVADSVWKQFEIFAKGHEDIDLYEWANYFAFDVVGTLALGKSLGFVEASSDHNSLIASIHGFFFLASNTGHLPGQAMPWSILQALASLVTGASQGFAAFATWSQSQIDTRRQRGEDKASERDMLDHFLEMKNLNGKTVGNVDVQGEVGNIIGAGADTTAIGIANVLGQLLLDDIAYARVRREVDDAVARSESRSTSLKYEIGSRLPYLQACIKEALRLRPSIMWQLPTDVPPGGITIQDYHIPASATVSMTPLAQNRCVEVFGPDADAFNPSRWLASDGAEDERAKIMNRYDTTFGYGSRTCIGKNLALVEITKFLSQLVACFDIELVDRKKGWVYNSMWFSYPTGMRVRIKKRHE